MAEIGQIIDGKYKILEFIAEGGMSKVYRASDNRLNKQWAIKEIKTVGGSKDSICRALAEADMIKNLSHPSIVRVTDIFCENNMVYIIEDFIEGQNLGEVLLNGDILQYTESRIQQNTEYVVAWGIQICSALQYLHSQAPPIIYRDMKPDNVMLKPDGTIALIDFGTARKHEETKTKDTQYLGTRGYAAPEQYGGKGQTDVRTDIYCLGVTLYHLVTGLSPWEAPYKIMPLREINPLHSKGLEKIILKCTQVSPSDRYQSCSELLYDLEHIVEIDDEYRKKQSKKLKLFSVFLTLTILFTGTSIWGYYSAENKKSANYELILSGATTVEDYYKAILTDPSRSEAYIGTNDKDGLLDFFTADLRLDASERKCLQELSAGLTNAASGGYTVTVNVLEQLEKANPEEYKRVCNDIGEALFFYSDVNTKKDRYLTASKWFEKCRDTYQSADIYCNISECLQNISKYSKLNSTQNGQYASIDINQTAKQYEQYRKLWEQIIALNRQSDGVDDDMKILIWREIVDMLTDPDITAKLYEVLSENGNDAKEQLNAVFEEITNKSENITSTFLKESINELDKKVTMAIEKVAEVAKQVENEKKSNQ